MEWFPVVDFELFVNLKGRARECVLPNNIDNDIDEPLREYIKTFNNAFPDIATVWSCSGHFEEDGVDKAETKRDAHVAFVANAAGKEQLQSYLNTVYRLWHDDAVPVGGDSQTFHHLSFSFNRLMNFYVCGEFEEPTMSHTYPILFIECRVRNVSERKEFISTLMLAIEHTLTNKD